MKGLYLSRIEINNFRTFGSFAIDLPASPGLTLIVGTNGLGKSCFFDGLEWCLTGTIRRFGDYLSHSVEQGRYLTRREAPENSHSVSLAFSSGDQLKRTSYTSPDKRAVINLLKAEEWSEIDDVGIYLAFTHFLGQSTRQRFTNRGQQEQWHLLKGPSGIDRIEDVRKAIRGDATRNAFTRRIAEQDAEIKRIQKAQDDWLESMARLSRLRQAEESLGRLSGKALDARIDNLENQLADITSNFSDVGAGTLRERLISIRGQITAHISEVFAQQAGLPQFELIVKRYLSVEASLEVYTPLVKAAIKQVALAREEMEGSETRNGQIRTLLHDCTALMAQSEVELADLTARIKEFKSASLLEYQKAHIAQERANVADTLEKLLATIKASELTIRDQNERHLALSALVAEEAQTKKLVDRVAELSKLESSLLARIAHSQNEAQQVDLASRRLDELLREEAVVMADVEEHSRVLEISRHKATQIAKAVALIASQIFEDDEVCPVCATRFSAGVLKKLAEDAAENQDATLAPLEAAHAALDARAKQIALDLASTTKFLEEAYQTNFGIKSAQDSATHARHNLAIELGVESSADLSSEAWQRHLKASQGVTQLSTTIASAAPDTERAKASGEAALLESETLKRRLTDMDLTRMSVDEDLRQLRKAEENINDSMPYTLDRLNQTIEERYTELHRQKVRKSELEMQLVEGASTAHELRQRLTAAQEERARLQATVEALNHEREALQAQWDEAGLAGLPEGVTLEARIAEWGRKSAALTTLLEEQRTLATADEASERSRELRELIERMDEEAGVGAADEPSKHQQSLKMQYENALLQRQLTESTRADLNAFAARLQSTAEEFSDQFLAPLNGLIDNYNRVLMGTRGESINFNASHNINRTQFQMTLSQRDQFIEDAYDSSLPPQIVLSEGQIAANEFSILCAASTAYPWSKWRALLLDDPLQHNDAVHIAAFVDMLRNLVEFRQYQLIMSSHDSSEADFFARKFEAAGLPCTIVSLVAPSKDGVLFNQPRYNAAAKNLMGIDLGRSA